MSIKLYSGADWCIFIIIIFKGIVQSLSGIVYKNRGYFFFCKLEFWNIGSEQHYVGIIKKYKVNFDVTVFHSPHIDVAQVNPALSL